MGEINRQLRAARKQKSWTMAVAAEACQVDIQTYARWELGEQMPRLSSLQLLMKGFGKSAEELGYGSLTNSEEPRSRLITLTSEQTRLVAELLETTNIMANFDPAKRETLTKLLASLGILIAADVQTMETEIQERIEQLAHALKRPSQIDSKTLQRLRETIGTYWQIRLYGSTPSPDLLHIAIGHLKILKQLLNNSHLPTARTHLSATASETALLAGMLLSTDMHKHREAESYYQNALAFAQQANSDTIYAASLGRMSALASAIGKLEEAKDLLQEAQRALTYNDAFTIRAWLAAEEAETLAVLTAREGEHITTGCFSALERAERLAGQIHSEEDTFGMHFDRQRIPAYYGSCNLRLQHPEEALAHLKDALEPLESSSALRRAVLLDLAEASIQANAIEQACTYMEQALEIITQTQATSSLQRTHMLRQQLDLWSAVPEVKSLDEQLRGYSILA